MVELNIGAVIAVPHRRTHPPCIHEAAAEAEETMAGRLMLLCTACCVAASVLRPATAFRSPHLVRHRHMVIGWRAPYVRCSSEMEWRKQQASGGATPASRNSSAILRQPSNLATDVDDLQFFGSVGGSTLTRQDFLDARKNINPVGLAEERLQKVVDDAGTVPPAAAVSMLKLEINAALVAGVFENAPQMRQARQLLAAIELAAANESAREELRDTREMDALASKMDIIFNQEFDFDLPDEL